MKLLDAINEAKALSGTLSVLREMKYKPDTTIEEIDKDYANIPDETNLTKRVLASCLDELEAFGYKPETTLHEIDFDLTFLKEKIEKAKELNGITRMSTGIHYRGIEM